MRYTLPIFLLLFLIACTPSATKTKTGIQETVADYYKVYQERKDFQKLLSFYAEDMIMEDIITADRKVGKQAFTEFFDWDNPNFSKLEENALEIEEQIIEGNKAVTKGYFTPFRWGEHEFPAMHFTTILTFNEEGKIIKHIDWINYPASLLDYSKRRDSNEWIQNNQ